MVNDGDTSNRISARNHPHAEHLEITARFDGGEEYPCMLIALLDAAHVHHQQTHQWFAKNRASGWATCPLTQNACIRIISQPAYPGHLPVADIARRLRQATAAADHHFWPDSISLGDAAIFDHSQILTPRHLTDLYLLALAAGRNARLV